MKEIKDNIWNYVDKHPIIIPTNGFIKRNGRCVMGRGLAKEALNRYPDIDLQLGNLLKKHGNIPFEIGDIITFPVKPVKIYIKTEEDLENLLTRFQTKNNVGKYVPGWMCKADINIIERSCKYLSDILGKNKKVVVIPKVGCGNGELDWNIVKPIIEKHLKNKVIIVDFR